MTTHRQRTRHGAPCDHGPIHGHRLEVDPHPRGADLGEAAVERALDLVAALREDSYYAVAEATDPLSRSELVALATALAAMVPADVDAEAALTWVEVPFTDWPEDVVRYEAARHAGGARDVVARMGWEELTRRRRLAAARRPAGLRVAS